MKTKKTRRELCAAAGADVRKLINENRDAVARELAGALEGLLRVVEAEPEACGIYQAHAEQARGALDKARKAGIIL